MSNLLLSSRIDRLFKPIFFILLLVNIIFANFSVTPFVLRLSAASGQMTGFITFETNQNVRPVAVELQLLQRSVGIDGVEIIDSIPSEDLIIYPTELIVYPGKKSKVQVSWALKNRPSTDVVYILQATEVSFKMPGDDAHDRVQSKVKTLVRYRMIVAVETGNEGRLAVISTKRSDKSAGVVEVVVENRGAGRISMDNFFLIIKGEKHSEMSGTANSIMPGEQRRFLIDLPFLPKKNEIKFGR